VQGVRFGGLKSDQFHLVVEIGIFGRGKGGWNERVRGVEFIWGLFACSELLHRRFGRLDSPSCSCCSGTDESPWHAHMIGGCIGVGAVAARTGWADSIG
jgi:hypothetical protein